MTPLLNQRDLAFLLYEFLDTESLLSRPRYAAHDREIFDATLNAAMQIAEEVFAPHNASGDANEPQFDGEKVILVPETKTAWDAFTSAGFLSAHWDASEGGLQLPEVVQRAALTCFKAANVGSALYPVITIGAANLLRTFGSAQLKARFLEPMGDGRFAGTMAMTEPEQGSTLGDIATRAEPMADGSYRLFGQKIFISGGDQCLTENIVHMVLARIQGAPAGVKGISLFLVPKVLVNSDGSYGERNDVNLVGLLHKMGWRNTTSTILSFGDRDGAVGYLVGEAGKGLSHMFQMMNEARIVVGASAAALACRGFQLSLDYARQRRQGRLPSSKNPLSPQVKLIEHADVRRLLLSQKAYAEGALALTIYADSLSEDLHTHPEQRTRHNAGLLLDILTPVVKSWSSRYGCEANSNAIQVLGGAGYTRDFMPEQLYRDQRLNMIHEGAEAIHAIDLLGRKVVMQDGAAYKLLRIRITESVAEAAQTEALASLAAKLVAALGRLDEVTVILTDMLGSDPDLALANATLYLDAFGRIIVAWIWLRQALAAQTGLQARPADADFYNGKLQAARYYLIWELPQTGPQFDLLQSLDDTTLAMQDAWF